MVCLSLTFPLATLKTWAAVYPAGTRPLKAFWSGGMNGASRIRLVKMFKIVTFFVCEAMMPLTGELVTCFRGQLRSGTAYEVTQKKCPLAFLT